MSDYDSGKTRYAVIVQHDYRFWSVEFTSRWEWPCRVVRWVHTRRPGSRWWGENVDVMPVALDVAVGDTTVGWEQ